MWPLASIKVAQLRQKVAELMRTKGGGKGGEAPRDKGQDKDRDGRLARQHAEMRERCKEAEARAASLRQPADRLKAERDRLKGVALRELGGEAELTRALEGTSGGGAAGEWRGRAQTISLLKDQLREARAQLRASSAAGGNQGGGVDGMGEQYFHQGSPPRMHTQTHMLGTSGATTSNRTMPAPRERQRSAIEARADERRREHERVLAEAEALRTELAEARKQYRGAQARRQGLEADARDLRTKLATVAAKTQRDDELIAALKAELGNARRRAATSASSGGEGGGGGGTGVRVKGYGTGGGATHDRLLLELARRDEQCDVQEKIIMQLQGKRGISFDGKLPAQ